jgi:uncharacterized protein
MKKIKLTLMILAFFLSPFSFADFELGMEYYNNKNLERAFKEFNEAAKNGDYDAQFNLGVMYLKGESTPKNLTTAYAWLRLASQSKTHEERGTYKKVYAKLTEDEKALADNLYQNIFEEYGNEAVINRLQPQLTNTTELKKHRITRIVKPEYPESKFSDIQVGWVDIIFSVNKDGTTRDHVAFFSSSTVFKRAALTAIRGFLFEPSLVNGKPVTVNGLRYRFIFTLHGAKYDEGKITQSIKNLREEAAKGNASDMFNYAYFIESIPSFTKKISIDENPNSWYLNAANKGHSSASFFIGKNLLNGNMCEVDGIKSANWLIKASQSNLSEAQYLLANESFSGARLEKNEEKGFYWLKRAASNNEIAKLRLSWILATHSNDSYRDINLATEYFMKVHKNHTDQQTYLQTAAAIAAEKGDFKNAIKWQQKAIKDAKKLDLPLETVNAQLASYQNNQPWREEP